jgi:hypothetical protein
MTNKQLSPAAQAVLDAAFSVYDCEALYSLTEEQHASMIVVAALRAASARMTDLIIDICHPKYIEGVESFSYFLDEIANELGALPND